MAMHRPRLLGEFVRCVEILTNSNGLFYFQTTIDPSLECTFGERFLTLNRNSNEKQTVQFPIDFKWPVKLLLISSVVRIRGSTRKAPIMEEGSSTADLLSLILNWLKVV